MEKEIEFIQEKIERAYPKEAIKDLFLAEFDFDGYLGNFEHLWVEAKATHKTPKVEEQPKEEKKETIKEYWLINKNNRSITPISIQEEAKEEFKKMMNWNEEEFNDNTCIRIRRT